MNEGLLTALTSSRRIGALLSLSLALCAALPGRAQGVELPDGFSETVVATGIQNPVGMEVAPDGRLFVLAGNVRRIEIFDDSGFLSEFIRLPQAARRGSGLLGLEFAPDFDTSGDVYIAYVTDPDQVPGPQRFRLSKFSSDGTVADEGSEVVIFEVEDIDPAQQQHQGGDLVIGADDRIYWALGDRVEGSVVSQPLDSLFGKLLRLNLDGTIPADNPFYADLDGDFRAIYANGLRNPFRMDQRVSTGEIFMSEVGPMDWEELNRAQAGANYGWPLVSGVVNDPAYTDPVHAYPHDPDGCAITGGAVYEPLVDQFPPAYRDKFFYGDHCFGWIAHVDLDTGEDTRFLTGADRLVEVKVSPVTGALYYLDREYAGSTASRSGGIGRVDFVDGMVPLQITRQPSSVLAAVGEDVSFDVLVTGEPPFAFQWFRNGEALAGETGSSLTLDGVQLEDDRSEFFVEVVDADGLLQQSDVAILAISTNTAPVPVITQPDPSILYVAGEAYPFAGTATDAEDGDLDASAFSWEIVFHHDEHTHPFISGTSGVMAGSFVPPSNDETAPDVWYRIYLTVTDTTGTATTIERDVFPLKTDVAVETTPPGLEVLIDGTPRNAPVAFEGVAGVSRVLEAPEVQVIGGESWTFSAWSNGGERVQVIPTPSIDTTYVATYERAEGDLPPAAGLVSPAAGSTVAGPVTVSGIATDDTGIRRVQLVIRDLGSSLYWDGSDFISGWRQFDAVLGDPDSPVTPWSYTFSPGRDMDVQIVARARQLDGASGDKEKVRFKVRSGGVTPEEPFVEITSPQDQAVTSDPVTIAGTVGLDSFMDLTVLVKEKGARNYWNGSDWQSNRIELKIDAASIGAGGEWSYTLDQSVSQEVPRNVLVRAFAAYEDDAGSRFRIKSSQVEIRF